LRGKNIHNANTAKKSMDKTNYRDIYYYFKKSCILWFLTAFGIVILDICFPKPDLVIPLAILSSFFAAIFNVVFILLLNLLNNENALFYSYKWMIVEIILFLFIEEVIMYIESLLPFKYIFIENASSLSRRFCFTHEFNQLYVFIFLYFALFLIRYCKRKP